MMSLLPDMAASSVVLMFRSQEPVHVVPPSPIFPLSVWVMLILPAPLLRVPDNEKSSPVSEMSPPFEARLPIVKSPVALKIMSPPLVDMVSVLLAKLMVPFVTVKVTELPLPCCRLSRLSLRSLNEILLVVRRMIFVDAETDSSVVS